MTEARALSPFTSPLGTSLCQGPSEGETAERPQWRGQDREDFEGEPCEPLAGTKRLNDEKTSERGVKDPQYSFQEVALGG